MPVFIDTTILVLVSAVYVITILLIVFYYRRKQVSNLEYLKMFLEKVEKGEEVDSVLDKHSKEEIGEVSDKLINLYQKLKETQSALSNEHQKTSQQEYEKSLIKRELTQNIRHELKTPVSSVKGYLETIINNPTISPEKKDDFIQKSYNQTTRITQLLEDLSLITRMDEASEIIEKEDLCLSEYVRELFLDNEQKIKEKGFSVENTIPSGICINANQNLINSLFSNLIENALAYSGGNLLCLKLIGDSRTHLTFSFSDNGIGIDEGHLARIFERFYRIDKGRSRKLGGTGLGLSIVKNAVLIHGGTIIARVKKSGGLEFVFSLEKPH